MLCATEDQGKWSLEGKVKQQKPQTGPKLLRYLLALLFGALADSEGRTVSIAYKFQCMPKGKNAPV